MPVQMGIFVFLMLSLNLYLTKVCFRCATLIVSGLQYVTIVGLITIPLWLANNSVIVTQVNVYLIHQLSHLVLQGCNYIIYIWLFVNVIVETNYNTKTTWTFLCVSMHVIYKVSYNNTIL